MMPMSEQPMNKLQRWDPQRWDLHENPGGEISAREGTHLGVSARVPVLRLQCHDSLVCRARDHVAHMSVALDGNNCCVASFFTKTNDLHVPSPFFPLRLIHLPSLCSCPLFVIDQNLALLSSLGGVWWMRDPLPTFLRRCSSTSPPVSRPRSRTPWTISVTSGAFSLSCETRCAARRWCAAAST